MSLRAVTRAMTVPLTAAEKAAAERIHLSSGFPRPLPGAAVLLAFDGAAPVAVTVVRAGLFVLEYRHEGVLGRTTLDRIVSPPVDRAVPHAEQLAAANARLDRNPFARIDRTR